MSAGGEPFVRICGVGKRYGRVEALRDVSLMVMKRRIGILLGDTANPFWRSKAEAYRRQAPEWGFEVAFREGKDARDPGMQAEALLRMYDEGHDALIVNPLNSDNLAPAIRRSPVPLLDVGPKCDPSLVRDCLRYHPVRVADFREQGALSAESVLAMLTSPGEGWAVVVAGFCGARQSEGRCRGALDVFRRVFPLDRIVTVYADFDRTRARAALRSLTERLDVRAVFCANDVMALGALAAFEERSVGRPPIGGVDAIPEALEAVRDGRLAGTVGIPEEAVVQGVYEAVSDVLAGRAPRAEPLVRSVLYRED